MKSASIREQLDSRLQARLDQHRKSVSLENGGIQDSPNTKDRKYKQMQNAIFEKIQAQLSSM